MIRRLSDGEKLHYRIGNRNGFCVEFGWRRRSYWSFRYFPIQRVFTAGAWRLFLMVRLIDKPDRPQPLIHYVPWCGK